MPINAFSEGTTFWGHLVTLWHYLNLNLPTHQCLNMNLNKMYWMIFYIWPQLSNSMCNDVIEIGPMTGKGHFHHIWLICVRGVHKILSLPKMEACILLSSWLCSHVVLVDMAYASRSSISNKMSQCYSTFHVSLFLFKMFPPLPDLGFIPAPWNCFASTMEDRQNKSNFKSILKTQN